MSNTLDSFSKIFGNPYRAIGTLLKIFDEKLQSEESNFLILLSAPTGYGKSSCTLAIADALCRFPNSLGERIIHVLPLRAIVEDLYRKALKIKKEGKLDENLTIGAQAMHILDVDKSPYMMPKLVYTTFDSFIHNLFKCPIAEMYRDYSHFDVPRYSIYSSVVIFDEAHLFSSEKALVEEQLQNKQNRMFTSFVAAIRALTEAHVPVVIMTATMPSSYLKTIIKFCCGDPDIYIIGVDSVEEEKTEIISNKKAMKIYLKDEKFFRFARDNNPILESIIKEEELSDVISKFSNSNIKILIVRNTVKKAVETFEKIKSNYFTLLLHGKMTVGDRKEALGRVHRELKENKRQLILVGTQVIEAGVNIDFDVLISDATVFSSLIQRIGRVGRWKRERPVHPEVYIIEGKGDYVYPRRLVEDALNFLRKIKTEGKYIQWKIPSLKEYDQTISYKKILEVLYQKAEYFGEINYHFFESLRDIDHYLIGASAIKLQRKLCNFVRDEGLITASVFEEKEVEFKDEATAFRKAYETFLALPHYIIKYKWKNIFEIKENKAGVLIKSGAKLKVAMLDEVYSLLEELERARECVFLRKLENLMKKLRNEKALPLAIVLRRGIYKKGVGLKID